jgi:hypothetical protein
MALAITPGLAPGEKPLKDYRFIRGLDYHIYGDQAARSY